MSSNYCSECGLAIDATANFCVACGSSVRAVTQSSDQTLASVDAQQRIPSDGVSGPKKLAENTSEKAIGLVARVLLILLLGWAAVWGWKALTAASAPDGQTSESAFNDISVSLEADCAGHGGHEIVLRNSNRNRNIVANVETTYPNSHYVNVDQYRVLAGATADLGCNRSSQSNIYSDEREVKIVGAVYE